MMTTERAVEIRERARKLWGRNPPADVADAMRQLASLRSMAKPTSILGPKLNEAALVVSRRLREEK